MLLPAHLAACVRSAIMEQCNHSPTLHWENILEAFDACQNPPTFAELVNTAMLDKGLNATETAALIGCNRPNFYNVRNGKYRLTPWFAHRLEVVLDIPMETSLGLQALQDIKAARQSAYPKGKRNP